MNRYVIYHFADTSKIDNNDPKNIVEIISAENKYYKFSLPDMSFQQSKVVIAAASLTSTNNESALSDYIYLERKPNGWQAVPGPADK